MNDRLQSSAGCVAVLHLLDSTNGHPLQTWRFTNRELITIGRNDGNDVIVTDPHVSRAHATIAYESGRWSIVSIGRHGTVINDRVISEAKLSHQTVFRLGKEGPTFRFDTEVSSPHRSETLDNISADLFDMLQVDEARKQQEVDQITGNALFQELKEQTRRQKSPDFDETAG
jgi:pSer/pThr/pTyr-binding forkhead associated (FHA) protein